MWQVYEPCNQLLATCGCSICAELGANMIKVGSKVRAKGSLREGLVLCLGSVNLVAHALVVVFDGKVPKEGEMPKTLPDVEYWQQSFIELVYEPLPSARSSPHLTTEDVSDLLEMLRHWRENGGT